MFPGAAASVVCLLCALSAVQVQRVAGFASPWPVGRNLVGQSRATSSAVHRQPTRLWSAGGKSVEDQQLDTVIAARKKEPDEDLADIDESQKWFQETLIEVRNFRKPSKFVLTQYRPYLRGGGRKAPEGAGEADCQTRGMAAEGPRARPPSRRGAQGRARNSRVAPKESAGVGGDRSFDGAGPEGASGVGEELAGPVLQGEAENWLCLDGPPLQASFTVARGWRGGERRCSLIVEVAS